MIFSPMMDTRYVIKVAIDKREEEVENRGYEESLGRLGIASMYAAEWLRREKTTGRGNAAPDTKSNAAALGRDD